MKKIISLSTLLVCCLTLAACNTSKTKKEATSDTTTVQETTSAQETTTVAESTIKDTQGNWFRCLWLRKGSKIMDSFYRS